MKPTLLLTPSSFLTLGNRSKLHCTRLTGTFPPAHLITRWATRGAFILALFLFTACGSSRKSIDVKSEYQVQEREERLSIGQSIFALFDSLNVAHLLEADSLELEVYDVEISDIRNDSPDLRSRLFTLGILQDCLGLHSLNHSLAATRPPQSQAPGRLAARLKVKGIRSNTQLTHTQTAGAENVSVDTVSRHRNIHEEVTESNVTDKEVKPPNTFLKLAVLVMAIAILLGVALFALGKIKK